MSDSQFHTGVVFFLRLHLFCLVRWHLHFCKEHMSTKGSSAGIAMASATTEGDLVWCGQGKGRGWGPFRCRASHEDKYPVFIGLVASPAPLHCLPWDPPTHHGAMRWTKQRAAFTTPYWQWASSCMTSNPHTKPRGICFLGPKQLLSFLVWYRIACVKYKVDRCANCLFPCLGCVDVGIF